MDEKTLNGHINHLRETFKSGITQPLAWRRRQLCMLNKMLKERSQEFETALSTDLRKSPYETYLTEIGLLQMEIDEALRELSNWSKPKSVPTPVFLHPARSYTTFEPLGVVLIIGAWNYPLLLTIGPLVYAIAAGNAAVIKPPRTASAAFMAMANLLPLYLDTDAFFVIGDDTPNELILEQRFDKIFFTGSSATARIVMTAAAKHLTPVTLELGGKSPALVDRTADLKVAARRIAQGKFFNAGQTCVAPDYVLADEGILDAFVAELRSALYDFFGPSPRESADFSRIINQKQFDQLLQYLSDGEVVVGGEWDREARYIAPTILKNVQLDAPVMQAEIFGPILPVLPVKDMDAAIHFAQERDKPLALYIFSKDQATIDHVLSRTTSGGACVNEAVNHVVVTGLPFGGVGNSGMGKYHGEWGFRELSNARAVLDHGTGFDPLLRYPPYNTAKMAKLKTLMEMRTPAFLDGAMRLLIGKFGNLILRLVRPKAVEHSPLSSASAKKPQPAVQPDCVET